MQRLVLLVADLLLLAVGHAQEHHGSISRSHANAGRFLNERNLVTTGHVVLSRDAKLHMQGIFHNSTNGGGAGSSFEIERPGGDGYADTDPMHPRDQPPQDDEVGDNLNWGPDAAFREVSVTGKMPDHFSLLTLFLGECHPDQCESWSRTCTWGLLITAAIMLWSFKNLKVISDVYFVPSTITIAQQMGMDSDVAGATLLAFGSSAPEFCTNIIATFFIVNECGIGDIIGSAIHNVLLVVGVSGLFAKQVLNLWWYPLSRDCFFYFVSIVELTVFLWDEHITLMESGIMILTYVLYIGWMCWNQPIYQNLCKLMDMSARVPEIEEEEDEEAEGICAFDPVEFIWHYTMPSCDKKPWGCFLASLFNIALLSYVMVDAATHFGCIMGIPTLFMGLVFLAAGTSIPDAFASMGAAKRGEGDMAVSNALGSNIFDILMGLGGPWFLALCLGKPIVFLGVNRLLYWVAILFLVLIAFMASVVASRWKLGFKLGLSLIFMYVGYVVFALHRSLHSGH